MGNGGMRVAGRLRSPSPQGSERAWIRAIQPIAPCPRRLRRLESRDADLGRDVALTIHQRDAILRSDDESMTAETQPPVPRWPEHLKHLAARLGTTSGPAAREALGAEAWQLLHLVLRGYLARHSARYSWRSREDLEDLAARKALELLNRLITGQWTLADRSAPEIASFLGTVAHNSLADLIRSNRRRREIGAVYDDDLACDPPANHAPAPMGAPPAPEALLERREYAHALRRCVGELSGRAQRIWFYRIFLEMPSKQIARHPEIGLKAPHVDVILQRCRKAIRECMRRKGYQPQDMPPGTFVELWQIFRRRGSLAQGGTT